MSSAYIIFSKPNLELIDKSWPWFGHLHTWHIEGIDERLAPKKKKLGWVLCAKLNTLFFLSNMKGSSHGHKGEKQRRLKNTLEFACHCASDERSKNVY